MIAQVTAAALATNASALHPASVDSSDRGSKESRADAMAACKLRRIIGTVERAGDRVAWGAAQGSTPAAPTVERESSSPIRTTVRWCAQLRDRAVSPDFFPLAGAIRGTFRHESVRLNSDSELAAMSATLTELGAEKKERSVPSRTRVVSWVAQEVASCS